MAIELQHEAYLKGIHAGFGVPPDVLESLVQLVTGFIPKICVRIIAGEANEVHRFDFPSGEQVFARIARHRAVDFQKEAWAIEKVRKVGVPVPEMLSIDDLILSEGITSVCLQKGMDGVVLDRGTIRYHELEEDTLRSYIQQAGMLLSRIHSIPVKGFGNLNGDGEGSFESFHSLLSRCLDSEKVYTTIVKDAGAKEGILEETLDFLSREMPKLEECDPVLIHNDYGPKHFMVKDGQVVGILDWGSVVGHSPIKDFSGFALCHPEIPLKWLMEGYEDKRLFNEDFEKLMKIFMLVHAVELLGWYNDRGGFNDGVHDLLNKMERIMSFSSLQDWYRP